MEVFGKFIDSVKHFLERVGLLESLQNADLLALLANPYFFVPLLILLAYLVYKQDFTDIAIIIMLIGAWGASGTEYMQTLIVDDEIQLEKVLVVGGGGVAVLGTIIYLLFGRSG